MGAVSHSKSITDAERFKNEAVIFNIERHALHDGPGIRTLVFFSGCTLRCLWCCNPEGQEYKPQLILKKKLCLKCGKCINICPNGAISASQDKSISVNREKCDICGLCVSNCPASAIQIAGHKMTVDEVFNIVIRDEVFYRYSEGGITVSGGEPLSNPEFIHELFLKCKQNGVNTAVETCGHILWANFEQIISETDLFLFDIKHLNSDLHLKYTGQRNELILENIEKLNEARKNVIIRIPVIPKFNDSSAEIIKIVEHVKQMENILEIHLLPYHRLGISKYQSLEKKYALEDLEPQDMSFIKEICDQANCYGKKVLLEV